MLAIPVSKAENSAINLQQNHWILACEYDKEWKETTTKTKLN